MNKITKQANEYIARLKSINVIDAKKLAIENLEAVGIIDEYGNFKKHIVTVSHLDC